MRATCFALALSILAVLAHATPAMAHGTRSVTVELTEMAPGRAAVHVRAARPDDVALVTFDAPCTTTSGEEEGDAVTIVSCPSGLAGERMTVAGLGPIVSEAIVVATLASGERVSKVLTADGPSLTLPRAQTRAALASSYVRLGVVHILTGGDHLLFLLALVLLLKKPRAILLAESAFTLSHSLSFSATALGILRVSAPAAEAAIALSLVLVALDVGKVDVDRSATKGAALAFVFGLVHGLGFAGGLAEIGLPDHDASFALLGFAGGVELGQIAFLAVLIGVLAALDLRPFQSRFVAFRRLHPLLARTSLDATLALLIGGVASSWLIERTSVCLSGG